MPVYNAAETLLQTLESIAGQSFEDFEVVAVDDGSEDGSGEILKGWVEKDCRFRVLLEEHRGIVETPNRGLEECRGEFVARMDADDKMHPQRLDKQVGMLDADEGLSVVSCLVETFPREDVGQGMIIYEEWLNGLVEGEDILREFFIESPIANPSAMMRREELVGLGGYRDRGWPEDYDLLLRLWAKGYRLGKVPDQLLRWREHADRLSRTDGRYSPASFLACKAHYLQRTLLRGMDGTVIWGAGPVGKAVARALLDVGAVVLAFVDLDPRKLGQEIYGAPVIDTESGLRMRGCLHLAAVGQEGARQLLRTTLGEAGLRELVDFAAVA